MKKLFYLLAVSTFIFSSCVKETVDSAVQQSAEIAALEESILDMDAAMANAITTNSMIDEAKLDELIEKELAYFDAVEKGEVEGTSKMLLGTLITVPTDYATIQDAIDNANDNDRILVEAGTYGSGGLVMNIDGFTNLRIKAASGVNILGFATIQNCTNILIAGFNFENSTSSLTINVADNTAPLNSGIRIIKNNISLTGSSIVREGIWVTGANHVVNGNIINVINSPFLALTALIRVQSTTNNLIKGNILDANLADLMGGIQVIDGTGVLIKRNQIQNCERGIDMGVPIGSATIDSNNSSNNGRWGIAVSENCTVSNNVCLNNASCDIAEVAGPGGNNVYINNTFGCINLAE